MPSVTGINSNYNINSTEEFKGVSYATCTKVKKVVLSIFASLALVSSAAALTTFFLGMTPILFAYLAIPSALVALGLAFAAYKTSEYKNPTILKKYQEDALRMNFKNLYHLHGIPNILQHNVVAMEELKKKFQAQVIEMGFENALKNFNFNILLKHKVITSEHFNLLQDFGSKAHQYKVECRDRQRASSLRLKKTPANKLEQERCTVERVKARQECNAKINCLQATYSQFIQRL